MTEEDHSSDSDDEPLPIFGGNRQDLSLAEALVLYGDVDLLDEFFDTISIRNSIPKPTTEWEMSWVLKNLKSSTIQKITLYVENEDNNFPRGFSYSGGEYSYSKSEYRDLLADFQKKLASGRLLVRGVPEDEIVPKEIESSFWNSPRISIDERQVADKKSGKTLYRNLRFLDPAASSTENTIRKTGPKTELIRRAREIYWQWRKEGRPVAKAFKIEAAKIATEIEKLGGKVSVRYLQNKQDEIERPE